MRFKGRASWSNCRKINSATKNRTKLIAGVDSQLIGIEAFAGARQFDQHLGCPKAGTQGCVGF